MFQPKLRAIIFFLMILFSPFYKGEAQSYYTLGNGELLGTKKGLCGFIKGKWRPGKLTRNGFQPLSVTINKTKKAITKASARKQYRKAASLRRKLSSLKKQNKTRSSLCRTVGATYIQPTVTPTPLTIATATPVPPTGEFGGVTKINWRVDARSYQDQIGLEKTFECEPNGAISIIYGTNTYLAQSSICTAAVHAGLITAPSGGIVKLRILGTKNGFYGMTRNGVESRMYLDSAPAYVFINDQGGEISPAPGNAPIDWSFTGRSIKSNIDQQFTFQCLPNGAASIIFGTNTYHVNSSLCTAAAHMGIITTLNGGEITVKVKGQHEFFFGMSRNSIESRSSLYQDSGFYFIDPISGAELRPDPINPPIEWSQNARFLDGRVNQEFTYTCLSNGTLGNVYGTDVYVSSTSICSAAVHAGLFTALNGGVVKVTILSKSEEPFIGTTRNGVTSKGGNFPSYYRYKVQ